MTRLNFKQVRCCCNCDHFHTIFDDGSGDCILTPRISCGPDGYCDNYAGDT